MPFSPMTFTTSPAQ
ncbi:unnamed protein product, partial [Adineta steineri]